MNPWNERFQGEDYVFGTEANVFIADMHKKLALSGDALAIAEGEGRNAVYLAREGMKVTVWDYAESGLDKAKRLAAANGVSIHTELVDLQEAQWTKDLWDEIICVFGHFPKELRTKTLAGVREAVKPGGYFLTEVYSVHQIPYRSGGPQDQQFLYTPADILEPFADWRIVHFFMGEVVRQEGQGHQGLSHVIQFAGQKPLK
ncbi:MULTISPECIES: bifunctional 2-polyprenyl-6-hydroxyphenol methylase/3-demethylubiquinol 3-O-methyltransferase UbiG [Paenibacillus]|uniref:class I SAM-dependent methyltransferase n=1 Tax=Paenibacillus TaxID=44249 RepID=UPI00116398D7|nr:class I SAM-dependent methyltransferase [Paenibacillus sp. Cedars]AWP28284.1 SAM-dependent methyltransferase [Paenibacillus sp. Cedars]